MKLIGVDPGSEDHGAVWFRQGTRFVCEVPPTLGLPTKLEIVNGKVVLRTESGISMIVPSEAPK